MKKRLERKSKPIHQNIKIEKSRDTFVLLKNKRTSGSEMVITSSPLSSLKRENFLLSFGLGTSFNSSLVKPLELPTRARSSKPSYPVGTTVLWKKYRKVYGKIRKNTIIKDSREMYREFLATTPTQRNFYGVKPTIRTKRSLFGCLVPKL